VLVSGTRGSSATAWGRLRWRVEISAPTPLGATSPREARRGLAWLIGAAKRAATGIYLRLRIIEVASVATVASSFKARRSLADATEIEPQHACTSPAVTRRVNSARCTR